MLSRQSESAEQRGYMLDPLSVGMIAAAVIIGFYYAVVEVNTAPVSAVKSNFMLALGMMGLLLHMITVGQPRYDTLLDSGELAMVGVAVLLGVVGVGSLQMVAVRAGTYLAPETSAVLMLVQIAIYEELFFRFWLQPMIERYASLGGASAFAPAIGVGVTSLVFAGYHVVYYGNYGLLGAVLLSSVVLCLANWATRRVSVPMLVHVGVNLLSVM